MIEKLTSEEMVEFMAPILKEICYDMTMNLSILSRRVEPGLAMASYHSSTMCMDRLSNIHAMVENYIRQKEERKKETMKILSFSQSQQCLLDAKKQ